MTKFTQQQALRAELRGLVQEQVLGAQQDGMKLGIKYGAKTLRDVAKEVEEKDPTISPDYIRGLRDAAVLIERFMEDAAVHGVHAGWDAVAEANREHLEKFRDWKPGDPVE